MADVQVQPVESLELVREKLRDYLMEEKGERILSLAVFRVLEKPFSITRFLSAETDRGVHKFVLKQHLRHPANAAIINEPDQASVEFHILGQLYERFAEVQNCGVPRPIVVLPEIDSFVMEFVDGHLLENDLRFLHCFSSRSKYKALQTHFYHCGRWLRCFQEFTGYRRAGPSALGDILTRCEDRLRMIEESSNADFPNGLRARVTDYLEECVEALSTEEIVVTGRHGDFGPWNIIVNSKDVTVCDFYGYQDGPVPLDVLKMLVFIDGLRRAIPNNPRRVEAIRERFLAGFGPLPNTPQSLLALCEAMHRIAVVAGITTASSGSWIHQFEQSAILRANLQWLLSAGN